MVGCQASITVFWFVLQVLTNKLVLTHTHFFFNLLVKTLN